MDSLRIGALGLFLLLVVAFFIGRAIYLRSMRLRNQLRLSRIFTNITHELLTPLTILSASVEKLRNEHPEGQGEYDLMDLNIQRGVRLLQQILETSKSQAGELKLLVSNGDVMQFIQETARCFLPLMNRKGLTFNIECKPTSMMGWIDTDKLDKILFNLLSNATKYTAAGGTVTLSATTNKHYDHVILRISDTGQGIPKDKMKHLFTRFYDGDYRYNQTFGTGLGLALTRDLVYLHGGTISCASTEGTGTTFTVELPINKEAFASSQIDERKQQHFNMPTQAISDIMPQTRINMEDTATAPVNEGAHRILIVEDNQELLMLMKMLMQHKYNILTATNGREALDVIQANTLDLIVSDVMMPEMNGLELTTHIKHDEKFKHLPIILLTAKILEEDQQEALRAGADDFMTKPFKLGDLQLHIDNLIANRQRIQSVPKPLNEETIEQIESPVMSLDKEFIERATNCVKEHMSDSDYDRETFASDMGSSVSTLYNKIKALTGMSVSSFVREIRIKTACQLAKDNPDLRVSDIAYRVGYRDPKYFATSFKRVMGLQPKEYFEHIRNGQDESATAPGTSASR